MDKAKKEFIWKRGVFGVGFPVGLLMSVVSGYQQPGYAFRLQAFNFKTFLFSLTLFMPIFLVAGYLWGIWVYTYMRKK